ncbi:hypothetical protein KXJ74_01990 [Acinetobacter johnsonii]|nr:hypothetical protein KXJ74_01990 [Acinetobacter johnsonii]
MRLKYLTFCVLGLSLSACTQHVIKSTSATEQALGERAAAGMNAIFETSSYDVNGQFSIQAQLNDSTAPKKQSPAQRQPSGLNPELKKQLDQLIKTQKLQLSSKERKQLYDAVAKEQDQDGFLTGGRDSAGAGVAESLLNVLNDLQFSYDGSVHYRQKMANLNLNLKYQKPTLLVQAQLPMIVDLNDFKLYTNYFAFMPFMVNRDSQASYAYVDFSKYKDEFNQVNFKNLALYLKQLNALPYALATPDQVAAIDLSAAEKQQGLSSKIRYQGTVEQLALQMSLFEWVNAPYYDTQVKGQKRPSKDLAIAQAEEVSAPTHDAAQIRASDDETEDQLSAAADDSATRVEALIQAKAHAMFAHEEAVSDQADAAEAEEEESGERDEAADAAMAATACASEDACDASREDSVTHAEALAASGLSDDACQALTQAEKVPAGYFTLCREWYGIDVFKPALEQAAEKQAAPEHPKLTALEQLKPIFTVYQSEQLTDVHRFKQLWQKHEAEIQQALKQDQRDATAFTMDVALDQAGRLQALDYDLLIKDEKMGQFKFMSHNQVSNYGRAKPIDRNVLKNAKSIEEVSKGSLLERASKGLLGSLGAGQAAASTSANDADAKTADEYLSQIALDTYKRTGSWLKSYQAVFGLYAAIKQSELSKHYSAAELNEIAELSAYHFNEDLPKPKGASLTRLNQLAEKHQLKNPDSFDDLGYSVNKIVNQATEEYKVQQRWNQRMKQHKTRQAVFASYYAETFADEYSLSAEQKLQLDKASQVFAQAFADDLKHKLSEKSIQNLDENSFDLFDDGIYRVVYHDVMTYLPK